MPAIKRGDLTLSDIVLLQLLTQRPMHGHRASLELARSQLHDWTGISRPQVYWSLNKLVKLGLISPVEKDDGPPPRQRRIYAPTEKCRKALDEAFGRKYWSTQHIRPLFLAWVLLASDVEPNLFRKQVARRKKYLERELARQRSTLAAIRNKPRDRAAAWVLSLNIEQLELELRWLEKLLHQSNPQRISHISHIEAAAPR